MDVRIDDLSLTFGDFAAVKHLDLHIDDGESLVLLGQSGCGKTTTMRCVAGLEDPSGGAITIGGTTVFDSRRKVNLAPNKRNVGLVFQSYAVWPHMTVLDNVAFPLKMKKKRPKAEIRTKALATLELVGLAHLAERGASMLSGGQMQRVALARSLAMEPAVMLLDEPLSNLDARLRDDLRIELRRLQTELGLTCIYVTHDQGEALALADRIAIMQDGRISQLADPWHTYRTPASATIAAFLGVANIFPVRPPEGHADRLRLREHDLDIAFATELPTDTGDLSVCVRPEHVCVDLLENDDVATDRPNRWLGRVEISVFQGSFARCSVRLDAGPLIEVHSNEESAGLLRKGDRVAVQLDPKHVRVLPGDVRTAGEEA